MVTISPQNNQPSHHKRFGALVRIKKQMKFQFSYFFNYSHSSLIQLQWNSLESGRSKLISILLSVFVRTSNKSHISRINSSTQIPDFQAPVPNGPTFHLSSTDLLESLTRLLQWKLSRFKTYPSVATTETNYGRVIKLNILRISRITNQNFQLLFTKYHSSMVKCVERKSVGYYP